MPSFLARGEFRSVPYFTPASVVTSSTSRLNYLPLWIFDIQLVYFPVHDQYSLYYNPYAFSSSENYFPSHLP